MASDEVTRPEYWLRQVLEPVRFAAGMATLEREHVTACIEIGPQPILLGMARQCVSDDGGIEWLPSLRKDSDSWLTLLDSVSRLYVRGAEIDWRAFDAQYARRRVSIPGYPFAQKEYWLRDLPQLVRSEHEAGLAEREANLQVSSERPQLYELAWRKEEKPRNATTQGGSVHWIILADRRGVGDELARLLSERGCASTLVLPGSSFGIAGPRHYHINPARPEDFERLWSAVTDDGASTRRVVHLWSLDAAPTDTLSISGLEHAVDLSVSSAVHMVQAAAKACASRPTVWVVTRRAVAADAPSFSESLAIAQAPVWGLGRTAALEYPELWGGLIDVSHEDAPAAAEVLAQELMSEGGEDQIAITESGRYVARLVRRRSRPIGSVTLAGEATYLVTGGVGALGLSAARWLVANGARRLVLASRRGTVDARAGTEIDSLEQSGAVVSVVSADVSRPDDVEALLAGITDGPSPLRGIVHAAGVDTVIPLRSLTAFDIHASLAAKVMGTWLLHDRTKHLDLDLFVCFSSVASVLGAQGRAHYSAANAFLDVLALERRRLGLSATTVNWGPWRGGGMATLEQLEQFERMGNRGLEPDDALRALDSVVTGGDVQQSSLMSIRIPSARSTKRADHDRFSRNSSDVNRRRRKPASRGLRHRGSRCSAPSRQPNAARTS